MQALLLTHAELIQTIRLDYTKKYLKKKKWLLLFSELLFITIAIGLNTFLPEYDTDSIRLLALAGAITYPLLFLCNWYVKIPQIANKEKQNKLFSQPQTIRWDEHYLYTHMKDAESKIAWTAFIDLLEDNTLLLLYTQERRYHVFPKRFFDNAQALDDFRQRAQQGIVKLSEQENS